MSECSKIGCRTQHHTMHDHRAQNAGHMTTIQYYAGRQGVTHRTTIRKTPWRRTQDGRRTEVERKSDESPTDVERIELSRRCCDGRWRRCTAAPGNATLQRGRQSTTTCCYGEAGKALQLATVARSAERCDLLLWRGPQWVATHCYGNGQQRCNSRRWADSALQPWPTLRYSIFVFCFFLLDNFKSERKKDRKRKGGRAFETCSKISTLLVGRNVTCKLLLVLTQAPSGSSNTNTLWLRQ